MIDYKTLFGYAKERFTSLRIWDFFNKKPKRYT